MGVQAERNSEVSTTGAVDPRMAFIADIKLQLERERIPDYAIVYIINNAGDREYYALNSYRSGGGVGPGDSFGPFASLQDLIEVRWLYKGFKMWPAKHSEYKGSFIHEREVEGFSDTERKEYFEMSLSYAESKGLIEPDD